MKCTHWLTGIFLSVMLILAGCGQSTPPAAASSAESSSLATPAVDQAAPAAPAASSAGSSEPAAVTEAAPETTETGTTAAAGPGLALRLAEPKPEPASRWKEGQHYVRLTPAQPTTATPGQVEVSEFFWYACPHCNAFDPYLQSWLKQGKADFVSFVRVPVIWSPGHGLHARIYYTAQALGKLDSLHTVIFDEFHQRQHPLNSVDDITAFFIQHGVSKADFQRAFTSSAVDASLRSAQELGMRFKVDSVPLIVINGKYVTDVGRAGGPAQLISLINDLASREHGH